MPAPLPPPPPHDAVPTPDAILDAGGFRVRVYGRPEAPAVVLLHGLILDGRMWDGQLEALRGAFRVIVPDFLNHGESASAPRGYSLLRQAEDLAVILDAADARDALLVGFSMGGMTAMQFAVRHPARVRGLALVNTSAGTESARARARFSALALSARLFGLQPWLRKRASEVMFGVTFRREHPEVVRWWDTRLSRSDKLRVQQALVIASDEDTATPPSKGRRIADTLPNASFQLIPRCGHCSPIEQPDLVAQLLQRFAERVYGAV
jgi:3-oxoadipate enol-lactonase